MFWICGVPGQRVHGEGERAERDRAGNQALGNVGLAEQFGGEGIHREHHDEQRHAAVGQQRAHQHDRQDRALCADDADRRVRRSTCEKPDSLDQLAEHRAQQEHREIQLQEPDHLVHEQAGEHRRDQRGIGQQHRTERRDRREQDDAVAAIGDHHQEHECGQHDQESHASSPVAKGDPMPQCSAGAARGPTVRKYDAATKHGVLALASIRGPSAAPASGRANA